MTDFEQKLQKISAGERHILQILSIFYEQITAQELSTLLRNLEIRTSEGRIYSLQYISLLRSSLIHKGFLTDTKSYWGNGFQIAAAKTKEFFTREAIAAGYFPKVVQIVWETFPRSEFSRWSYNGERTKSRLLRDYRISIYSQNTDESAKLYAKLVEAEIEEKAADVFLQIFSNPFQKEFLAEFINPIQSSVLQMLLSNAIENLEPTTEFWEFVRASEIDYETVKAFEINELIYKGELAKAEELLGTPNSLNQVFAAITIAALEKNYEKAVFFGDEAIKLWKKAFNKKKGFPDNWQMFVYGLSLFKINEAKFYTFAEDFYNFSVKNYPESAAFKGIKSLSFFLKNADNFACLEAGQIGSKGLSDKIVGTITAAIVPSAKLPNATVEFISQCREAGYRWLEMEAYHLASTKEKRSSAQHKELAENLENELGFSPLGNLIPPLEDWERALNVLSMVAETIKPKTENAVKVNETRVAWQVDFQHKNLQPVEQKFGKTGWSAGRNIALKRLYERDVKNLTEQDSLVVKSAMYRDRSYYYGGESYEFTWEKAVSALVGHPNLFSMQNPLVNVHLVAGEPALIVKERGNNLDVSFDIDFSDEGTLVLKETETRYKIYQISKQHTDILSSFKGKKLTVPAKGRESLMKAIQAISAKVAIQSDLEEHFENLPSVEAENRIHALITPNGDGFHLEFFVKPFGKIPPYFKPGKGTESVLTDLDGVRTRTKRDLKSERKLLGEIENSCPFLAEFESPNYEWLLSDAEACLTALTELETPRTENKLVIEWTKGQKLKLLGNITFENFSMSVKGNNNWFDITAEAKISEDLVLSMQQISKLLSQTTGNFIELTDGQFVAITEKLRKHLQSLASVMDDKMRLHNLRSGILDEFSEELENFKADKAWKDNLTKLKNAQKFVPELPKTFEAELRPYQIDGYNWLSRLANWGVGACLADDMGLGKTLQALAILVERAEKGAALVVAPVSVCRNWIKEAIRFAPTLNFQIFGAGDRKSQVESLGKYDVLVASYSLLQSEEELFTNQNFATIVLDEAQAIKNRNTKRSKTVMNLHGEFRLITTGTPIENHLGELWNLFNFTNPGLLGSHEFFNEKFASPIEKNKDENTRKTLQRLIKPFILRRRKNQVLDDLPPKTEITLTVEMSAEERAFYEAIRREALEKIESQDGGANDKRFRILAELTRLRLACCHPKLVNADIPLGSSKLDLFGETLDELLENKHKALVFSQFVKHLSIVRKYLDEKGISYQYLDGSTPSHVRQDRIDDFQRGIGEVFLISLKAGGMGLNLTAADYVIHLDPWWNPAVEDQATDRVHRIGQQRPVTVYRLVTADTVEEKILKLHETKRDLADSLLDGTDSSSKLTAEDLLAFIKGDDV